jgi:hypothetical protein
VLDVHGGMGMPMAKLSSDEMATFLKVYQLEATVISDRVERIDY